METEKGKETPENQLLTILRLSFLHGQGSTEQLAMLAYFEKKRLLDNLPINDRLVPSFVRERLRPPGPHMKIDEQKLADSFGEYGDVGIIWKNMYALKTHDYTDAHQETYRASQLSESDLLDVIAANILRSENYYQSVGRKRGPDQQPIFDSILRGFLNKPLSAGLFAPFYQHLQELLADQENKKNQSFTFNPNPLLAKSGIPTTYTYEEAIYTPFKQLKESWEQKHPGEVF